MTFQEVRFPDTISYGARSGGGFMTQYMMSAGGTSFRIGRQAMPKMSYDVGYGLRSFDDLVTVRNFFMSMRGGKHGFRFKDFLDFSSSATDRGTPSNTDQQIGIGDATETQYQLTKTYNDGLDSVTRNITKPVSGTVTIAFDGVDQGSGWSVDTTTGIVTFTTAPSTSVVITAGFEFDVPVFFSKDTDEFMGLSMDAYETGSIPSIKLEEEWLSTSVPEDFYYGGSIDHGTLTDDITISMSQGRVHTLDMNAASKIIYLPQPSDVPDGGPLFIIENSNATNTVDIKVTGGGSSLFTIGASSTAMVWCAKTGAGTNAYIVM